MNQEFIPYEQALALKELGFDEPCFAEYRQWNGNKPWLQLYQDLSDCSTDPADYEYTTECLAPLYQQAFRWFREKYKMHIISPDFGSKFKYKIFNLHLLKQGIEFEKTGFDTYEEAELACLIKLIEIVSTTPTKCYK